jgi:hypothetical protein
MKCLATMRRNGWPRLSETSGVFIAAGHLWLVMIPSAKAADVLDDPRVAVHCGSPSDEWDASARVTGWARVAVPDDLTRLYEVRPALADPERSSLATYTIAVTEAVVTGPEPSTGHIAVEWWTSGGGVRRSTRPAGR